MKRRVFLLSFILLMHFFAAAQNKKDLVGTWYGKIRTYPFIQDGTARFYTKRKIENSPQRLVIDKDLDYSFTEYYRGDTLRTKGHVLLTSDTITFVLSQTNQKMQVDQGSAFFLYVLNKSMLVYSNSPAKKIIKAENAGEEIFQKVETSAEYSLGNDEFLAGLYRSLNAKIAGDKDSVSLHSYRVKVDASGNIDIPTLVAVDADPAYFDTIRQGLLNLRGNFKPAMQNGRAVAAYMNFKITY